MNCLPSCFIRTVLILFVCIGILPVHTDTSYININNSTQQTQLKKSTTMELPAKNETNGQFKSFMDYRTITDESSKQFKLQEECYTDDKGFRRIQNDYVVAMGTHYAKTVGKRFKIYLENNKNITVTVGDIKQDIHTDKNNQYVVHNGNIVEFIVNDDVISEEAWTHGDVSVLGLHGKISKIERID